MKIKKLLIHSLMFSPDGVSTAYLYNDIALGFKENGYEVTVISTTPHFNIVKEELEKQPMKRHLLGVYYTSIYEGIKIYHIPLKKHPQTTLRILSFVYFHVLSILISFLIGKIDAIISPSPPLTIGLVSIIIGKFKRAKIIYNVQEVYPDLLIKQGNLKNSFIINFLKYLEKIVYNNSDAVITIDEIFYNNILERFDNHKKLSVIPNFVDTDIYKEVPSLNKWSEPYYSNRFRILYAGNIGYAQDWDTIIAAATALQDLPIEFWIIGEGSTKIELSEKIIDNKLNNIILLPYQARHQMPFVNAFADVHFIAMNTTISSEGFPSKVYTIMACAKPVIVLTEKNTPIFNFLSNKDCYNYHHLRFACHIGKDIPL